MSASLPCSEKAPAVEAGTVPLVGTDYEKLSQACRVRIDSTVYSAMSHAHNPYGDGHAVERIIEALKGIKQG